VQIIFFVQIIILLGQVTRFTTYIYMFIYMLVPGNNSTHSKKNNMEEKRNFNTPKAPRMSQAFPQAVLAEKFVFVSGTPGLDLDSGKVVSDSFEDQTRQAFQNIKIILEEAGSSISKVVKTTIFMVAGNDFSVINKVYGEFFPENPPARSTPQVMPFPAGILISVECIALC
jgi:2-iminobutanoate/2-iminopropanoate deaminase